MLELAQAIVELTGSRSPLVYQPTASGRSRQRQPDITLARKELGWEPKTPLHEGLRSTIAYFEAMLAKGKV